MRGLATGNTVQGWGVGSSVREHYWYRRKDRKQRLAKEQWEIVEKKREEAERLRKIAEAAAIEARF